MTPQEHPQPIPARGITYAELRRRRRLLETEAAIEEIRLVETVRKMARPLTLARTAVSFVAGRVMNRFTLVDGILFGVRHAGPVVNVVRRLFRRK